MLADIMAKALANTRFEMLRDEYNFCTLYELFFFFLLFCITSSLSVSVLDCLDYVLIMLYVIDMIT